MIGYGATDLARSFRTVRRNTLQIADEIPEEQYGFVAAPGGRTVAQLLTHIGVTHRMQQMVHSERAASLTTVNFTAIISDYAAEENKTRTQFATWLETLTDDTLAERVDMFPGAEPSSKTRFEMLLGVKEHEMHHRGQLMLIQRMLGITTHLTRERLARMNAARA
jgi:uncharacterized damage-inducible protein DinB